jgi:hypothetical protein
VPAKQPEKKTPTRRRRPATTPEGRENQLITLAVELVEKRLREGTATSQETTHYLKLGSTREQLEQQRIRNENELTQAKIDALASQVRQEELYAEALIAMKAYSGQNDSDEYSDDYSE